MVRVVHPGIIRLSDSTSSETRREKSNAKLMVAFMKLFLPDGFQLDVSPPQYRDDVLGVSAKKALLTFLLQHNITARGAQNVLKCMRKLHKSDHLNDHIRRYQQRQAAGCIFDPPPGHTNNLIALVCAL
ncbi:LOW QUALITY PROTEIN: hypothetical protein PHMEG_00020390 [Phytophthora megakarya]|uniref:Uncharacterized protein n=1 Tax=Phytophthora megakarya TaxID=4795 RepID=A0A225VNW9_9STRA|nr:LOW QUALITY PROTEIN: hypothetical protein PHMEG_00020390 [Phytophthora megakarya]